MAVDVVELHHIGLGMGNDKADEARDFYRDVLALTQDAGRWHIPGIHGYFLDVPSDNQIHLLGSDGPSPYSKGPGKDPVENHIALAVSDILAAEEELQRLRVDYFTLDNVASPNLKQLFIRDPAGNLIELHQVGLCRCRKSQRAAPAGN
ncbi:VOC family protein [Rhizorhabdus dicambivorans]|uniref:Glyoxalase n=1 Tax=Rhizorhabdus dicambivorans TaxID=1850238 RepID=A0A2A4FVZ8_9SPHN|nr:VOC family protein [Rhizorhabdus dicambivorans]ATE65509.1 glyoxalase [Rhizorhabdus dicambivorans]PCE41852.1 glyoxalase [Rhizorhabdus dicambivorans]